MITKQYQKPYVPIPVKKAIEVVETGIEKQIIDCIVKLSVLWSIQKNIPSPLVNMEYLGFFRFSYSPEYSIRCSTERIFI